MFDREVTELRALDPRPWRGASSSPSRIACSTSLDGLITLRVDYLPHAGVSLLRLRLRLGAARPAPRGGSAVARASAPARPTRTPDSRRSRDLVASRPEWLAAFRESDPDDFARRVRDRRAVRRPPRARRRLPRGVRAPRGPQRIPHVGADLGRGPRTPLRRHRRLPRPPRRAGETGEDIAAAAAERLRGRRRVRLTRSATRSSRRPRRHARASRSARTRTSTRRADCPCCVPRCSRRSAPRRGGSPRRAGGCAPPPARGAHGARRIRESADAARCEHGAGAQGAPGELRRRPAHLAGDALPAPRAATATRSSRAPPAGGGRATGPVRVVLDPPTSHRSSLARCWSARTRTRRGLRCSNAPPPSWSTPAGSPRTPRSSRGSTASPPSWAPASAPDAARRRHRHRRRRCRARAGAPAGR